MSIIVEILQNYILKYNNQFSGNLDDNFENYILELYENKSINNNTFNSLKEIFNYYKINIEKFNNNFLSFISFVIKNIEINKLSKKTKKRNRRYSESLLSKSGDITKPLEGVVIEDITLDMFFLNLGINKTVKRDDVYSKTLDKKIIFK